MYKIIKASCDLGVMTNGTRYGATILANHFNKNKKMEEVLIKASHINKSTLKNDKAKNLKNLNNFNERLYNEVFTTLKEKKFPIILGGDHAIVIASALADAAFYKKIGIIWIDSHTDYNTFDTTITGNLHGLPLAAINNYHCDALTPFATNFIDPKNTVIVGARSVDELEYVNIKKAGATIFTTNDINKEGLDIILEKAFKIALNNTEKVHISYDLDFIDPLDAPGVTVKAKDGISKDIAIKGTYVINKYKNKISSFDLVEYNPLFDKNNITRDIALNILKIFINETKTSD